MLDTAVKSNVVREKFSVMVDEVIHGGPKVVSRTRDHFVMMNMEHIGLLVQDNVLHVTIEKDSDGTYLASISEIADIFVSEDTEGEAVVSLANDLIEYAKEYMHESFSLYFNAPNRKKHFPYVVKVMMQNSVADVVKLFNVKHKRA